MHTVRVRVIHDAAVLGAFIVALLVGWFITHSVRDFLDWRGSVDRMKSNRSDFYGGLPRALIAAAIGLVVIRALL